MTLPFILKQMQCVERSHYSAVNYSTIIKLINRLVFFITFLLILTAHLLSSSIIILYLLLSKNVRSVKASGSFTSKLVANLRYQGYVMGLNEDTIAQYFATSLGKVEVMLFILYG